LKKNIDLNEIKGFGVGLEGEFGKNEMNRRKRTAMCRMILIWIEFEFQEENEKVLSFRETNLPLLPSHFFENERKGYSFQREQLNCTIILF
jgi:hypothetical protein